MVNIETVEKLEHQRQHLYLLVAHLTVYLITSHCSVHLLPDRLLTGVYRQWVQELDGTTHNSPEEDKDMGGSKML